MKLNRIEVRNYRSFFAGDDDVIATLDLRDGMNTLVGPNNCGKSNLLRAVALAMDPTYPFDRDGDMPAQMMFAFPRIVLHFGTDARSSTEKTLLRYAEDYEQSATGGRRPSYAERGELRFVVTYRGDRHSGGVRQEFFQAAGAGNRQGDTEKRDKLLRQFRKSCRFVLVESGESLQSLLTGRFREILHMVIQDHLREEIAKAEQRRKGYIEGLQSDLLAPLRKRVDVVVKDLFPEITGVTLEPRVPAIDATLSDVDVRLTDTAETALANKGTGVRGAVMVAMLRYLADQTRRSMVFAVEEPEAFLHPGAQEALRDDLESLAERRDVSLLVTTHSPFIVSRDERAQIVGLTKEPSGRTVIVGAAAGNEPQASLLGGLFRDATLPDLLDRVAQVPTSVRGILVVEGTTDREFLEIAARAAGRSDLLEGLHIAAAGGASRAVVQAVLHRNQTGRPVRALLDSDEAGVHAAKQLCGTFGFQNRKEVISYRQLLGLNEGPIEAEDLWPDSLLTKFVAAYDDDTVLAEKTRLKDDRWHYGFTATGKDLLPRWLSAEVEPSHCGKWIDALKFIRSSMGLD